METVAHVGESTDSSASVRRRRVDQRSIWEAPLGTAKLARVATHEPLGCAGEVAAHQYPADGPRQYGRRGDGNML